jgi:hypothetical protein
VKKKWFREGCALRGINIAQNVAFENILKGFERREKGNCLFNSRKEI